MDLYKDFPVLVIDASFDASTGEGFAVSAILDDLKSRGFKTHLASNVHDGLEILSAYKQLGCVLVDWETVGSKGSFDVEKLVEFIRHINDDLPIFVMTEHQKIRNIALGVAKEINGYIWKMEDTADFIGGRIALAVERYVEKLSPPFFKALVNYAEHYKYAWHTPGHMGGEAFLKSPAGRVFYDFVGENILRADLSVSVPELGSLMEHTGVTGKAEREAAEAFGADYTFFVTNGTSTANKIVLCGSVKPGDVVLVDRNCHKSLQHALTLTGAVPVYFMPTRNALGIIGGIHLEDFDKKHIQAAIDANPLIKDKKVKPALAVVTNSTYDGVLYDVVAIKEKLSGVVDRLHFDEAWYAYAKFHHLYDGRHGMTEHHKKNHPTVFATQSTHKLLAAFSQASMVHVKNGLHPVEFDHFNEAFMMHTSTSPQYTMIASLDVATKMMKGAAGRTLLNDTIREAIVFRQKVSQIKSEIESAKTGKKADKWFFDVWQPDKVLNKGKKEDFEKGSINELANEASQWAFNEKDAWHGYQGIGNGYLMLDPIKVSIVTPGILQDGKMGDFGIPAPILASFLITRGIVDEKTGFYTFLLLFSIGVTKGKSGTLLTALFEFKELYDNNALLEHVLPELVAAYPERYEGVRIQEFANEMHTYLKKNKIAQITQDVFSTLPKPIMTPAEAYWELVDGKVENVPLSKVKGKVAAAMLVPYPPGIPIIMPGEKFDQDAQGIIDYLKVFEAYDNLFPGFETETHGLVVKEESGRKVYYIPCLKK